MQWYEMGSLIFEFTSSGICPTRHLILRLLTGCAPGPQSAEILIL